MMNFTAVTITALICLTVGFIAWLAFRDEKGGKR